MSRKHESLLTLICHLCLWAAVGFCAERHTIVNIFSLTTVSKNGLWGRDIVGAQRIYINEINENPSLFPNYTFKLCVLDSDGSTIEALKHSLSIISFENKLVFESLGNSTHRQVLLPIVLGAPWSSLSVATSPVLSGFNFAQISSSATSIQLSDTENFKYFYRTPPSDNVQSIGIIKLCQLFGWDKIAIMYVNNAYGLYLAVDVQTMSLENKIESFLISYELSDISSYQSAAKQIKSLNVFIIVLIAYAEMVPDIFEFALKNESMIGYPYYYIGDSAWFDQGAINTHEYAEYIHGFIGLVLWQVDALDYSVYANKHEGTNTNTNTDTGNINGDKTVDFYNRSLEINQHFQKLWNKTYHTDSNVMYNVSDTTVWAPYGYDAMRTVFEVLSIYNETIDDIDSIWDSNYHDINASDSIINNQSQLMEDFKEIIINQINFIGATGNVSFDQNGDRNQGLYLFGNIIDTNGTVNYFGYYYFDPITKDITMSNIDIKNDIVWPTEFVQRNITPQAKPITLHYIKTFNNTLITISVVCIFVSILIQFLITLLLLKYKQKKIIRSASYKLNIIACMGAALYLISLFLYSIDEDYNSRTIQNMNLNQQLDLNVVCNVRAWILTISFTLLFMPFFLKTYRISKLFHSALKPGLNTTIISDKQLMYGILLCLCIDLLLLSTFYILSPFQRAIRDDKLEYLDDLRYRQHQYGVCTCDKVSKTNSNDIFDHNNTILFTITIGVWKLIELLFGCVVGIIVSQIIGFKQIARLDETGSQIISIFVTISLVAIMICGEFFQSQSNINFHYCILVVFSLIIINITIFINISQRLYYVIIKKDKEFMRKAEEKMERFHRSVAINTRSQTMSHQRYSNTYMSKSTPLKLFPYSSSSKSTHAQSSASNMESVGADSNTVVSQTSTFQLTPIATMRKRTSETNINGANDQDYDINTSKVPQPNVIDDLMVEIKK